jgi:hypothetical protein
MFGIPWKFLAGVLVGAILVKESDKANETYQQLRRRISEILRSNSKKDRPQAGDEPGGGDNVAPIKS